MAKQCSNCKWFHENNGAGPTDDTPHCRRYPPVHIGPERTRDGFVTVRPDLSCGEYKRRK